MLAAEADLCVCVRAYVCVCAYAHTYVCVHVCVCMCAKRTVANVLVHVHVPCTTIHSCVLVVVGINEYIHVRQRFDTLIKGT